MSEEKRALFDADDFEPSPSARLVVLNERVRNLTNRLDKSDERVEANRAEVMARISDIGKQQEIFGVHISDIKTDLASGKAVLKFVAGVISFFGLGGITTFLYWITHR